MDEKELSLWAWALGVTASVAIITFILPNLVMMLLVMVMIGIVMELSFAAFTYLAIAFVINLCLIRFPRPLRLAAGAAAALAFGVITPIVLNAGLDADTRQAVAGDHPTPHVAVRTLALFTPGQPPRDLPLCDNTCLNLLLSHRVDRIDYGYGDGPDTDGWTAQTTVSYRLVRGPCPSDAGARIATDSSGKDGDGKGDRFTARDRHFRLTGECLTQMQGTLSDADVIVVKPSGDTDRKTLAPGEMPVANFDPAVSYVRTKTGFVPGGRHTYYTVPRYLSVWLPVRGIFEHGDDHVIGLFRAPVRQAAYRDMTVLKDLAVPLATPRSPDPSALRAQVVAALDRLDASPASGPNAALDDGTRTAITDYLFVLTPPFAGHDQDPVYPPYAATPADFALVARLDHDPTLHAALAGARWDTLNANWVHQIWLNLHPEARAAEATAANLKRLQATVTDKVSGT